MSVEEFARAVYTYAQKMGVSCTSWGRTVQHNIKVGGVPGSPHLSWRGMDLVYDTIPVEADAQAFAKSLGLLLIRESDHDHVQPLTWPQG